MASESRFGPEVEDEIIERLEKGESLLSICRLPGMPSFALVAKWAGATKDCRPEFGVRYARARELYWLHEAEKLLEIADDGRNDFMERESAKGGTRTAVDHEAVARSRLRFDARRWVLSKMIPRTFGDAAGVNLEGKRLVIINDPDKDS